MVSLLTIINLATTRIPQGMHRSVAKRTTQNLISHLIEQRLSKTLFNEMRTKKEGGMRIVQATDIVSLRDTAAEWHILNLIHHFTLFRNTL